MSPVLQKYEVYKKKYAYPVQFQQNNYYVNDDAAVNLAHVVFAR